MLEKYFFRKDNKEGEVKQALENPFCYGAAGKKEWNDRYFNMAKAKLNWQIVFGVAAMIIFLQTILISKLALDSKVRPFVVETNQGIPYSIKPIEGISASDNRIINYAVNQFIINSKSIVADPKAQEALLDSVTFLMR